MNMEEIKVYDASLGLDGTIPQLVDWANRYTNDYSDAALIKISDLDGRLSEREVKMSKIYQPRMEVTSRGETKESWQDWGQFDTKREAVKVAKELLRDIKEGKYDDCLNDSDKAKGYYLNACVEVLDDDSFDLLYIEEVA